MRPRDEIAAINQQHWEKVAAEEYRPTLGLDPAPLRDYGAGRTHQPPARLVEEMYPADLLAGVPIRRRVNRSPVRLSDDHSVASIEACPYRR